VLSSFIRGCQCHRTALAVAVCLATSVAAAAAEKPSTGKHCLWRVTDAKAPVYLLGSVHALRASDYPLPAVIENAIQQSQQFFFECDPNQDALQARKWEAAVQYPPGVQIKGKIKPQTYKFLMKITKSGMNVWQHLKPWAIAAFILQHPGFERVRSAYGVDNYVVKKATARKCPMSGLESVDEHVNALAGMTDFESEVYLLEALVFADQGPKRYAEGVAAWKAGNTQRLLEVDLPEIEDAPGINSRLLYNRNARWIPKIEGAIKSGRPTMIVAGAMHFAGPRSVTAMLRARGYKIEQL
jgi:uncharacterized protein YbaP (TraB family)